MELELGIAIFSTFLAIFSIILVFITEWIKRPFLEFPRHKDEPTSEDKKRGYMWYHLKAMNKEPSFFNRDAALQCVARVDFLEKNTNKPLVDQITTHWTSQPKPRDQMGRFDYTKVAMCQRIDVGFREEMFDVLIKFEGEKVFYVTNPWIIYPWLGGVYPKGHPEFRKPGN